jgi:hypothetical protein
MAFEKSASASAPRRWLRSSSPRRFSGTALRGWDSIAAARRVIATSGFFWLK